MARRFLGYLPGRSQLAPSAPENDSDVSLVALRLPELLDAVLVEFLLHLQPCEPLGAIVHILIVLAT